MTLLYHYTNAAGLLGVIRTGSLWATSAQFVNDETELEFARAVLSDEVRELLAKADPDGSGGRLNGERMQIQYLQALARLLDTPPPDRPWSVYVSCFCSEGDLLSQWRGYGNDGYAIGFDRDALASIRLDGYSTRVELTDVKYGDDAANAAVNELLATFVTRRSQNPDGVALSDFNWYVLPLLASIKHSTFEEEREVRLTCLDHLGIVTPEFRTGRLGIIPYVPIELPDGVVREVVVGPTSHPALRDLGIRQLLRAHGLGDVGVQVTNSPLRV